MGVLYGGLTQHYYSEFLPGFTLKRSLLVVLRGQCGVLGVEPWTALYQSSTLPISLTTPFFFSDGEMGIGMIRIDKRKDSFTDEGNISKVSAA